MSLYNLLPIITYDDRQVRDISHMMNIVEQAKANTAAWDNYVVVDGESPESLAQDMYNDPKLNWVILLMNDIIDPFYDWALTQQELYSYVEANYNNVNDIHHYVKDGYVVSINTVGAVSVSNLIYEESLNEEKRKIKILNEAWIDLLLSDVEGI